MREDSNLGTVKSRWMGPGPRFNVLGVLFALIGTIIIIRLVTLQFGPQVNYFDDQAKLHENNLHTFYPPRGQIYDRWGHLLAGSELAYEIGAQVAWVENPETIAFALSKVLSGHEEYNSSQYYDSVFSILGQAEISGTNYVQLADFVTPEELAELQDWYQRYEAMPGTGSKDAPLPSLSGLVYRPRTQRNYPEKDLASTILGFVRRDGLGILGVEGQFNNLLAGDPQLIYMPLDPYKVNEIPDVSSGADLVLTIDREIQAAMENILDDALAETGAVGGTILVMDPSNGEIFAMASSPRMDLNEYWNFLEVFPAPLVFNRAVSQDYEPGSVFKVLTMAAGLDSGAVKPDTVFMDTGSIAVGGITIHNWDYGAWGPQDMQGCMQHSLNVCLTWVATQLGAGRFYDYLQNFGIGHLTGVDLMAEVPGRLKLPGDKDWYEADLATNSFGQGIAVTPLQLAMAISSVANHGNMMAPHVVRSIIQDGYQYNPAPQIVGTPISAKTARRLTELLAASLENESSDALITGYRVAGKTGTAEIPGPMGYSNDLTNASFVGWGPLDDPQFIVYIWLEKPQSSPWGSVVAAPVFREVVEQLVILMDIPPDDIRARMGTGK